MLEKRPRLATNIPVLQAFRDKDEALTERVRRLDLQEAMAIWVSVYPEDADACAKLSKLVSPVSLSYPY